MAYDHKRYRKIRSSRFLKKIQNGPWERVLLNMDDKNKIEDSCVLLKYFEGCFIKIDGIICTLKYVKTPPSFSCVLFEGGGIQWFAFGSYFNIYLPLKHIQDNLTEEDS